VYFLVLLPAVSPAAGITGDVGRAYYMEKRGDGVPIILRESERLSGKKPIYQLIDDSELLLTIYAAEPESFKTFAATAPRT